jgi:hypothetical protein
LRAEDEQPVEDARLGKREEREEVHPLVLRILEEGLNPASVTLEAPERVEVTDCASDHALLS